MRSGWKPDSTWIEFDCGPYLAKHQHLDQNQITIYHRGYLAVDSGADYTDSESPHYLNYYRRTVAHNSILIYDPSEKFFWSQNLLAAANDGGQRMDSSRFWNTIRSPEDFERTRDLWNLGSMRVVDHVASQYHYAMGDASNAYSREKLKKFTREVLYFPAQDLLFVFDRVVSTHPSFKKAWLLHGVNEPSIDQDPRQGVPGAKEFKNASIFCFREASGELLVHSLLPRERMVTRRGGTRNDFYTPGDDHGGSWGTGENWPLEPQEGGPLPQHAFHLIGGPRPFGDLRPGPGDVVGGHEGAEFHAISPGPTGSQHAPVDRSQVDGEIGSGQLEVELGVRDCEANDLVR